MKDEFSEIREKINGIEDEKSRIECINGINFDLYKKNFEMQMMIKDLNERLGFLINQNNQINEKIIRNQEINDEKNKKDTIYYSELCSKLEYDVSEYKKQLISSKSECVDKCQHYIREIQQFGEMEQQVCEKAGQFFDTNEMNLEKLVILLSKGKLSDYVPKECLLKTQKTIDNLEMKLRNEKRKRKELKQTFRISDRVVPVILEKKQYKNESVSCLIEYESNSKPILLSVFCQTDYVIPKEKTNDFENEDTRVETLMNELSKSKTRICELIAENSNIMKIKQNIELKMESAKDGFREIQKQVVEMTEYQKELQKENQSLGNDLEKNISENICLKDELTDVRNKLGEMGTILYKKEEAISEIFSTVQNSEKDISLLLSSRNSLLEIIFKLLAYFDMSINQINSPHVIEIPTVILDSNDSLILDFDVFPADLKQILNNLGSSFSENPKDQIRKVFNCISKWIDVTIDELIINKNETESRYNALYSDYYRLCTTLSDQFLIDINKPMDFIGIRERETNCAKEMESKLLKFEKYISDVCKKHSVSTLEELLIQYSDLGNSNQKLYLSNKEWKKKYQNIKKDFRNDMLRIQSEIDQKDLIIQQGEKIMSDNNLKIARLEKEILSLEIEKRRIINENDKMKNDFPTKIMEIDRHYNEKLLEQSEELTKKEYFYQEQMKALENSSRKVKAERELMLISQNSIEEKLMMHQMESTQYKNRCEKLEKLLESREVAKNYCINRNDQIDANQQNSILVILKEKVECLEQNLIDLEAKYKDIESERDLLKDENNAIRKKLKNDQENIDRVRKLCEAQLKTKIFVYESNSQIQIQSLQHDFDQRLRTLIQFFTESFSSYYDPSTQINENTFKTLVLAVKNKLIRMSKKEESIRKMINANECESIEEALANYLFSKHAKTK